VLLTTAGGHPACEQHKRTLKIIIAVYWRRPRLRGCAFDWVDGWG